MSSVFADTAYFIALPITGREELPRAKSAKAQSFSDRQDIHD